MPEPEDSNTHSYLLDQEQLEMLVEAGGEESSSLLDEIFGLFESESSQKLEELRRYKAEGNFEMLGKAAHALSGSSANIGGQELARQAKRIENLCKNQQGESAAGLLDELETVYRQTIIALNRFCNR